MTLAPPRAAAIAQGTPLAVNTTFEDRAIEFAMAFELSPPSWEPPVGPKVVPVKPRPFRAFQGWRYLDPADAPPDVGSRGFAEAMAGWDQEPPPELLQQLKELGLI